MFVAKKSRPRRSMPRDYSRNRSEIREIIARSFADDYCDLGKNKFPRSPSGFGPFLRFCIANPAFPMSTSERRAGGSRSVPPLRIIKGDWERIISVTLYSAGRNEPWIVSPLLFAKFADVRV